jgi:hypothetical protein
MKRTMTVIGLGLVLGLAWGLALGGEFDPKAVDLDALKREVTADETKFLQREIDRERVALLREQPGLPPETAMKLSAERLEKRLKRATMIEKRNAYLNRRILLSQVGYVANVWKGRETEGLLAILTGSVEGRKGARSSAAAMQEGLRGKYHGGSPDEGGPDLSNVLESFGACSAVSSVLYSCVCLCQCCSLCVQW